MLSRCPICGGVPVLMREKSEARIKCAQCALEVVSICPYGMRKDATLEAVKEWERRVREVDVAKLRGRR